jgi:dienelactone hydrolase
MRIPGALIFTAAALAACSRAPARPAATAAPVDPVPAGAAQAAQPTEVQIPGKAGALRATLWRPEGDGPFPAIVYNHGSEPEPRVGKSRLGPFFARNGYAALFPYRRGAGGSEGTFWEDRVRRLPEDQRERATVDAQVEDNDDVLAAIDWVRAQGWAARDQIVVAGCSFGGIQTLLTAERPVAGLRAAVDFAGGAIMWERSPLLRERLRRAAEGARVPVFFVQAENDFSTAPSRVLSDAMRARGKPQRMEIFPAQGTSHMDGHSFCVRGAAVWGPAVLEFLRDLR